ncbi:hypothetical protein [Raineyella sp. W15-4]|uniref:hypothetical protein n=1 Tax=Raineyella sp. W15-4 TaxID=3081651 RepID=UPI0029557913|nr:hypothetical protein [Raineyella sp. W15-4]WOQ16162.1 hypothetical protein R0145_13230 [Raineyella sp. W15-4]
MRRPQWHGAGGAIPLMLAGLLSLGAPVPRSVLTGSVHACITESAGTAWLGLHFRVLSESSACPQGSYAPGPHFTEVGHVSIAISASAVIAGAVLLLWALGLGWWARRASRSVRAWVTRRLGLTRLAALPIRTSRRTSLEAFLTDRRSAVLARPQHRRGPPVPVTA